MAGKEYGSSIEIPGLIGNVTNASIKYGTASPHINDSNAHTVYFDGSGFTGNALTNTTDASKYQMGVDPYNDQFQKWQRSIPEVNPYATPYKTSPAIPYDPFGASTSVEDMAKYFKQYTAPVRKTATEELLEDLFDASEKEQFLINLGYEIHEGDVDSRGYIPGKPVIKRKLADGTYKTITNTIDELFLIEAKIKLKNLLMAKATLKFKF